jgi:tRNA-Thr(GGU) m(6)t(6)A37 methyltransferase TsaA
LPPRQREDVRRAVEQQLVRRAPISTSVEMPFGRRTQRVLNLAVEEADALQHAYVGSEHLLLGLLREDDPIAAAQLGAAGVRLKNVREHAAKGRSAASDGPASARPAVFSPIGVVRSPYHDTAAVPKGLGARHEAEGRIEIREDLAAGLADIEGFSHLFVIWWFDRVEGVELTAYPPSDNRPHGVFATRSPQRPNPIGLTVVELLRRDGSTLHVRGVDMLDGTPVLDIKPYLGGVAAEQLRRGWLDEAEKRR